MESEWIVCMQCDAEFEFAEDEQVRYADRGYDAPCRCPECRKHRAKLNSFERKKEPKNWRKKFRNRDEDSLRRPKNAENR